MKKEFEILKALGIDNYITILWNNPTAKGINLWYRFNTTTGELKYRGEFETEEKDFLYSSIHFPPISSDEIAQQVWKQISEQL